MNNIILALTVILGLEDELWIPCLVDVVEWTHPKYGHQN